MAIIEKRTVLFLCTGNYYRSRFAEILFNELAKSKKIPYRADSCGLALERASANFGPISLHAKNGLQERGISVSEAHRFPKPLSISDLMAAQIVIALNEEEHLRLMEERFPEYAKKIMYWNVKDLEEAPAAEALPMIETLVTQLASSLSDG